MIEVDELIEMALREDIGDGDITTSSILKSSQEAVAHLIAKEHLILAGIDVFHKVYKKLDSGLKLVKHFEDGEPVTQGSVIAEIKGEISTILKGERVALNFLQHLSGIATHTHTFVVKVKSYPVKILDTRKTTPGWRSLEKYAVKMGGGENHRLGLFDAVLIKDNHSTSAGGISEAVRRVRSQVPNGFKIEVETKNLQEVKEALASGVNTIMLDNMSVEMVREAVALVGKRALVEASGNVTLDTVEEIAGTGVDLISIGALTHSAPAADISLKIVESSQSRL
jgi:nicotinate-nucleotide pyrophosphorylase (carboxylating)